MHYDVYCSIITVYVFFIISSCIKFKINFLHYYIRMWDVVSHEITELMGCELHDICTYMYSNEHMHVMSM